MADEGRARVPRSRAARFAIRAALIYLVAAVIWILVTDRLVDAFASGALEDQLSTVKGLFFVALSAGLVYVAVRRYAAESERNERAARASEDAFRRSEERYRSLVERVPGVVYLNAVHPDDPTVTRCIYIGPPLVDLLGYEPHEWIDDPDLWVRIIHPDDRDEVVARNRESLATGEFSVEFRMLHRDGSVVWIHDESLRIADDDGRPLYWQGIMIDITAQRMADAAVHGLTESLRGVFAASPVAISVIERDTTVRHWNRAAEEVFGWTADEVIGRPLPIVPADARESFDGMLRHVFDGEGVTSLESDRVTKDGRRVAVNVSVAPLRDADGNVDAAVGVLEDVTERRRIAAELERRAEMLDHVTDAVIATDETFTVVYWNRGAEVLYGWTREETIGRPVRSFVRLDVEPDRLEAIRAAFLEAGLWRGQTDHLIRDGRKVPVDSLTVARSLDDGSRYFVSVNRDVSERAAVDAALAAAEARYRGLVERGPAVVYLHDTTTAPAEVTYVSPQIEELLGYAAASWTDDPLFWVGVTHPEDRERVIRADRAATESGEDLDIEYRFVHATGRDVWVHDHSTVIVGPSGEPLFRQGLIVDVSDRRRAEEERRHALDRQLRLATRLELLHQIDREIRSATTVEELGRGTLERLRSLLHADFASIGVFEPESGLLDFPAMVADDEMEVPAARAMRPDDETLAMLRQDSLRIDDLAVVRSDSPYVDGARAQGLRSVLTFAMYAGGDHIGVLIVGSRQPAAFGEEAEDIGREVASSLAIAIRQQHLRDALSDRADQLEQLAQERQQMLRRIVRAQEEERERVALELHDGLGQILTSISLFASDLEDEVPDGSRARASRVNELVRRAIADSRQLVWSLRPPELERLGLVPALRRLTEEASRDDVTVDLHDGIGDLRLGQDEEAVVYRVVQEALHNAQKHANASAISILLRRSDGVVSTIVEDNGSGFDPIRVEPGRGFGIIGMRERAELVEGRVVVESAAGAGTRVRLEVPISVP